MHRPGVELAITRSQVRRPNHYTEKSPRSRSGRGGWVVPSGRVFMAEIILVATSTDIVRRIRDVRRPSDAQTTAIDEY